MAIFDKPFVFDEMLRRTIFKGRPNFFNAKDFNKELLIIHSFIEEFNGAFAVSSDLKFTVPSFSETYNSDTEKFNRTININWVGTSITYKGVKFKVTNSGIAGYEQEYTKPNDTISPKEVKPPTYIILRAKLKKVTYAENPTLCGIQSDEIPNTAPTVDVEQYSDVELALVSDFELSNIEVSNEFKTICVVATIHPKYKPNGDEDGFGFLYNAFRNDSFTMDAGQGNTNQELKNNSTLFEYILERVSTRVSQLINERQLVRRFNLADLENTEKARHNIGLNKLTNHKQLVIAENLRDLTNLPIARQNLGLGNGAVKNVGSSADDLAPGNIIPVGFIGIWSGNASNIPNGWLLCNGENETPNLRGRFIVGLDPNSEDFNLLGKTGGGEAIIDELSLPNHTHEINDPGHTHVYLEAHQHDRHDAGSHSGSRIAKAGSNTSRSYTGITILPSGGQTEPTPIKTIPPYFTLTYIMYKGTTITAPSTLPQPPALVYPNFSEPTTATDGGAINYEPEYIGSSNGIDVGSGILLTNPE